MIVKNYLLISLRNLLKNKVYIGINVVGMGVAIACCIIAYLNFRMNTFFDAEHVDTENVW